MKLHVFTAYLLLGMFWLSFTSVRQLEASFLANGGFEDPFTTNEWPTEVGVWGGDGGETVTAENGITPFEGSQMFKFVCTQTGLCHGSTVTSDLLQYVDMGPFRALVDAGLVTASASAHFNRVTGQLIDTEFHITLYAYGSEEDEFPLLGEIRDKTWVGGDPESWAVASVTNWQLPVGTAFLEVRVGR